PPHPPPPPPPAPPPPPPPPPPPGPPTPAGPGRDVGGVVAAANPESPAREADPESSRLFHANLFCCPLAPGMVRHPGAQLQDPQGRTCKTLRGAVARPLDSV